MNQFNRHTKCTEKQCKRVRNQKVVCRFGFPIKLKDRNQLELIRDDEGNLIDVKFEPATNDKWMNKHCLEHMFTWRANTDASFVTSALGILFQITKYVVKAEPKSNALKMINENVINRMSATDTQRNYIYKSLCDQVSVRDFSVNEITH